MSRSGQMGQRSRRTRLEDLERLAVVILRPQVLVLGLVDSEPTMASKSSKNPIRSRPLLRAAMGIFSKPNPSRQHRQYSAIVHRDLAPTTQASRHLHRLRLQAFPFRTRIPNLRLHLLSNLLPSRLTAEAPVRRPCLVILLNPLPLVQTVVVPLPPLRLLPSEASVQMLAQPLPLIFSGLRLVPHPSRHTSLHLPSQPRNRNLVSTLVLVLLRHLPAIRCLQIQSGRHRCFRPHPLPSLRM